MDPSLKLQTILFPITALLVACVSGPDYHAPGIDLPQKWPAHETRAAETEADWVTWWRRFGDPALDTLVERALDQNLDIRQQTARVAEFRARLGLVRTESLPSLDAQANAARDKPPASALSILGTESPATKLFSVAGLLRYEVDLWGRLAREREAAEALLQQSLYARDAVRLGIVSDVVVTYFDLRTAENQLRITRETIASWEESLRLQQIRFDGGEIDELALQQARSEYEGARAELPDRIQRQRVLEGALGVLLGLEPAALWQTPDPTGGPPADVKVPDRIPSFLPSELLERRPDLRAAEANLMAATADIGAARAARLPRLNLSALLGAAAISTGDIFSTSSDTWNLDATLAGPIWDFGRGAAREDVAASVAEQAEAAYRAAVTAAFNEVRNALIIYEASHERSNATQRLVDSLARTEELAQIRYREGFISIIELLYARRTLLSATLSHEQARRDQFAAVAVLFKALGGGWAG